MGLFVQCLYALSLHLVSVVFGTAIPTSLNIFGKCFIYLCKYNYEVYDISMCANRYNINMYTIYMGPQGNVLLTCTCVFVGTYDVYGVMASPFFYLSLASVLYTCSTSHANIVGSTAQFLY